MDVLMPQLGETVKEGKISTWFKKPGDWIDAGENLFEIETDKVSMEVQAIESGKVTEIRVAAGAVAPVGAVVAVIGESNGAVVATPAKESAKAPAPQAPAAPTAPRPARSQSAPALAAPAAARNFAPFNEVFTPAGNFGPAKFGDIRITPLARRLIAQNGLDSAAIAARARNEGRTKVAARDVQQAMANEPARRISLSPGLTVERQPLNRVRRQTAKHLAAAWRDIPHVVQTIEVDFGAVSALRDAVKDDFRKRYGAPLSFLPFIARAVCLAVASYPRVNAALDGDDLLVVREVNLGFAVDLAHEGLVVPVLKNADQLSLAGLATGLQRLADKARANKLTPEDLEGGTYSITNNGSFGTLFTAPLINAPQVAILSTDAIRKRPVVVETQYGDAIVARPVGVLAQSFDHRAFDGAYSAAFLQKVKEIIETRDWRTELA